MATYSTAYPLSSIPPAPPVPVPVQRSVITDPGSSGTLIGTLPAFYTTQGATVPLNLNQALNELANLALVAGNGTGILAGLGLSVVSGLTGQVASGIGISYGSVPVPNAISFTCADNSTNYIWLMVGGTIQVESTTSIPSGAAVFLGIAITASGAITNFESAGVRTVGPGGAYRSSADRCIPSDSPTDGVYVKTKTLAGTFEWDGAKHQPVGTPVVVETLSGTFTGSTANPSLDMGRFLLDPSGTTRTVLVPTHPTNDQWVEYVNSATSGSANLVVKDPTGTTTICTLTNGQSSGRILPRGNGAYPTTAATPI